MAIRAEDFNGKNPYAMTPEEILLASADPSLQVPDSVLNGWVINTRNSAPRRRASPEPNALRATEKGKKQQRQQSAPSGPVTGRSGGAAGATSGDVVQPEQPQQQPVDTATEPKTAMVGEYGGGTHESDLQVPEIKMGAQGWEKRLLENLQEHGLPWLARNPTVLAEPNLHPLYAWSDQMFGSNYSKGYQRPEPLLKQIISGFDAANRYRTALSQEKDAESRRKLDALRAGLEKQDRDVMLLAGGVGSRAGKTATEIQANVETQIENLELRKNLLEIRRDTLDKNDTFRWAKLNQDIGKIDAQIKFLEAQSRRANADADYTDVKIDRVKEGQTPVPTAPKAPKEPKTAKTVYSQKERDAHAGAIVRGFGRLSKRQTDAAKEAASLEVTKLVNLGLERGLSPSKIDELLTKAYPAIQKKVKADLGIK